MSDRLMRQPLLDADPEIESVDRRQLHRLVAGIEQQATERYERLAATMARRGETGTAAALRLLLEQQHERMRAVQHWTEQAGMDADEANGAELEVPARLEGHWDEFGRSALLSPYRVFALAVESARRAFAFYSYLSARVQDPALQSEIETLAAAQLRHAASLRQLRRRAWRAERRPMRLPDLTVASHRALDEVLTQHEAAIAKRLGALADQLRRLGDEDSAELLKQATRPEPIRTGMAPAEPNDEDHVVRGHDAIAAGGEDARALLAAWVGDSPQDVADDAATPGQLLVRAQKPLEAFSETLESILRTSEGPLFEQAADAMGDVTTRLELISRQAERRLQDEDTTASLPH